MPYFARIEFGLVKQIVDEADVPPENIIAIACVGNPGRLQYVAIPDGLAVEPRWRYDGGEFLDPKTAPPALSMEDFARGREAQNSAPRTSGLPKNDFYMGPPKTDAK